MPARGKTPIIKNHPAWAGWRLLTFVDPAKKACGPSIAYSASGTVTAGVVVVSPMEGSGSK